MSTFVMTIAIAIIAIAMFALAFRAREHAVSAKAIYPLRQQILRECTEIMGDETASLELRAFMSRVSIMVLSHKLLVTMGNHADELRKAVEREAELSGHTGRNLFLGLSAEERDRARHVLWKFSLASLAFAPQHAKYVRTLAATGSVDDFIARMSNHTPTQPSEARQAEAIARVTSSMPRVFDEACFAV